MAAVIALQGLATTVQADGLDVLVLDLLVTRQNTKLMMYGNSSLAKETRTSVTSACKAQILQRCH
jgi:hypothetical protein